MSELRPGKGFHGDLSLDVIRFLAEATEEIREQVEFNFDATKDEDGDKSWLEYITEGLVAQGWEAESDKFGDKWFKQLDWQDGAYRVTVVITSRGQYKLDIRHWYGA